MADNPDMKVHSWRSKATGKWHLGAPRDYKRADRIRARYVVSSGPNRGKEKFVQIKRWPDKPGLNAQQQTEFIESRLHIYFDQYRLTNA